MLLIRKELNRSRKKSFPARGGNDCFALKTGLSRLPTPSSLKRGEIVGNDYPLTSSPSTRVSRSAGPGCNRPRAWSRRRRGISRPIRWFRQTLLRRPQHPWLCTEAQQRRPTWVRRLALASQTHRVCAGACWPGLLRLLISPHHHPPRFVCLLMIHSKMPLPNSRPNTAPFRDRNRTGALRRFLPLVAAVRTPCGRHGRFHPNPRTTRPSTRAPSRRDARFSGHCAERQRACAGQAHRAVTTGSDTSDLIPG